MTALSATTVTNRCTDAPRVLLLQGSPHPDGPTALLTRALCEALPRQAQVAAWDCYAQPVRPCDDCGACRQADGCIQPDLQDYYALLEAADALIFATPVHNLSFSAPLKTLIDRSQRYWSARFIRDVKPPIPRPKRAVLLTAAGSSSPEGGELVERQLKPVLTILHARLVACVHYAGADSGVPLEPHLAQARAAAALLLPEG